MARLALLIEYLGKNFSGSQSQLDKRTVQSELETAISTFMRQPLKVVLSSRTDSGVHALGQVAHCDINEEKPDQTTKLDLWRLVWGLNGILAEDVCVRSAQFVPSDFHARHSAVSRQYVYRILNRPQRSPLLKNTHYFFPQPLDHQKMIEATSFLVGNHDFASFRSSNGDEGTSLCTVLAAQLLNLGEGRLEFWIEANHFVYNMVRIIVGTLIEIGLGEKEPECLINALREGNRNLAGPTAPAWGLTLASVKYPESLGLFAQTNQ